MVCPQEPFTRCILNIRASQIINLRFGITMFVLDGSLRVVEQNFDVYRILVKVFLELRRQAESSVGGCRRFM